MTLLRRLRTQPNSAAEWLARVRSGRLDSRDDEAWDEWMSTDARNARSYENVELAWELSEELRDRPLIEGMLRDVDLSLTRLRAGSAQRRAGAAKGWVFDRTWRIGAAAAALVLICAAAVFVATRPSVDVYATEVGQQRTVTLADNSTIALNTATQVRVRYSRALRRIEIVNGEAVFTVTHDANRPFEVHALRGTTTAVGTEFDVQISGETTAVSVLEGTVTVRPTEGREDGSATQISAGQAVEYKHGATSAIRAADAGKVRGWLAQRIVFSNVALAEALADYNRYIKTPIVLGDPNLGAKRINGVFRMGDERAFLDALEQGLHLTATATPTGTVLQPR
jgi:transmembrane sensor